jgi:serine/threonine protein kinase
MSTFPSTLSAFCSGNVALSEVLTVLRADLARNRASIPENISLVDQAWRSGKVGDSAYRALRETITGFDTDETAARQQDWTPIRASRHPTPHELGLDTDQKGLTLIRSALPMSVASNRLTGGNPSWPDVPPLDIGLGTVLKERFILEEEIGRGGMGTVFKARDLRKEEAQDRDPFVAVKVLNEDFRNHPESFKALQREAKKSQALAHPNVASVFDFDRDGSTVFLVMELLEGPSLHSLIESRAGRGLPRSEVLRIVHSVGAALAHAHKKGVIHSDFKPANVIRTFDGTVKVLDFGIARAFLPKADGTSRTTRFDVAALRALTPAYASPEMLLGQPADPRDDVFALACVTYELLSGRHPFGYSTALAAQREGAKLVPIENVHRKTWRALQHALAFSRAERTPSVAEFLNQLEPAHRMSPRAIGAAASVLLFIGAAVAVYFVALQDGTDTAPKLSTPPPVETAAEVAPVAEPPPVPVAAISAPPTITQAAPSVAPAPEPAPIKAVAPSVAAPVEPPRPARPQRELSVTQLKERTISLARTGEIPDAIASLRELQAKVPGADDPIIHEATASIAQAYAQLAERTVADGNYTSAIALMTRASEMIPNSDTYSSRRQQIERIARFSESLQHGSNLSVDVLREELGKIRESEGPQYYAVRSRLASVLVQRIQEQGEAQPETRPLIDLAQQLFEGIAEIDRLRTP